MKNAMTSDRRALLKLGAAGAIGLSLPDILCIEAQSATPRKVKAEGVILVWLGGGPATIDMWDMKPDAPEEYRGEFKTIDTRAPGVRICEHLPKLAEVMDRCAIVRSLQHPINDHGVAAEHMATGHAPSVALQHPSIGAIAANLLPGMNGVPPYIKLDQAGGIPTVAGFLGSAYEAFTANVGRSDSSRVGGGLSLPSGFSSGLLADRDRLRQSLDNKFRGLDEGELAVTLDRFQQQAVDLLRSERVRKAFDISSESDAVRARYGQSQLGRCALTARRLIEAGARFVTIGLTSAIWDTHTANFRILSQQLLPELDRTLSSLVTDLGDRGLLDRTVVYCAGEFGRTPRVNPNAGRDHWARSMAVLLAGGGIKGGSVYGSTDSNGVAPDSDPCSPADVSATLLSLLGIKPTHEIHTPSGRPVPVFKEGKVIESIVG
jgi:uncharacterized protein (DUF1501 family)